MNKDLLRQAISLKISLARTAPKKFYALQRRTGLDGRNHGSLTYCGADTGRWASLGINLQNLMRPAFDDVDACIELLPNRDPEGLNMFYGDSIEAISSCIRGMLISKPLSRLLVGDYTSVEAMTLPWLAGEEGALNIFKTHGKIYEYAASQIFDMPIDEIGKKSHERFCGKTTILACIAEGELVLTDQGLVPIEKIKTCMKVWDGVEWVKHSGIIYRGEKNVSEYQGLTATSDHMVWTDQYGKISFAEASSHNAHLTESGSGGDAVWVGSCDNKREKVCKEELARSKSSNSVLPVPENQVDKLGQFEERGDAWLPEVQSTNTPTKMVEQEADCGKRSMYQSFRSKMGKLWRSRNKVSIRQRYRCWALGDEEFRSSQESGTRQNRQQWELCPREFKMGNKISTNKQHQENSYYNLGRNEDTSAPRYTPISTHIPKGKILGSDFVETPKILNTRTNCRQVGEHNIPQTKRRVWDILNAGPRNRFTVSGKLVSNCGYQGGWKALQKMARDNGIELEDKLCAKIVALWRKENQEIVGYWDLLQAAAVKAIQNPGKKILAKEDVPPIYYRVVRNVLYCQLPSGRLLSYNNPLLEKKTVRYFKIEGEYPLNILYNREEHGTAYDFTKLAATHGAKVDWFDAPTIRYYGVDSKTYKWSKQYTYGGSLSENVTQAVARDLLAESMLRLRKAGYKIVLHVHDEVVAEMKYGEGTLEEFLNIMVELPDWAKGLPVKADGYESRRYRK